jgi:hypothetical protein
MFSRLAQSLLLQLQQLQLQQLQLQQLQRQQPNPPLSHLMPLPSL